jgi:hypothetical protein
MDTEDNTHESRKLTAREICSLADRLFSRGVSMLYEANRNLRVDLVTCSALLRRLAIDNPQGLEVDVWKELP